MWEPDTLRAGPAGPGDRRGSGKKYQGPRGRPRGPTEGSRGTRRDTVQGCWSAGASCRRSRGVGRSPSTVSAEVASHRFVTAPKSRRGERVDASAGPVGGLPALAWPRWPQTGAAAGTARSAASAAPRLLRGRAQQLRRLGPRLVQARDRRRRARRGGQAGGDKGLHRAGSRPEQMAARNGGWWDLSPSTIYRWVSAGYDGMTNMELRRKGRLQAEEERRRSGGHAPLRPPSACRVPRPRGGVRRTW